MGPGHGGRAMKTMECSEIALRQTARMMVETSRLDASCTTFADVLARAESSAWPGLAMTRDQRKRFRKMLRDIWLNDSVTRERATSIDLTFAPPADQQLAS